MGSTTQTALFDAFDTTWNSGDYVAARQLLYDARTGRADRHDALYWRKRAKCELHFHKYSEAELCMVEARATKDFEPERDEMDYERDLAIALIRKWPAKPPIAAEKAMERTGKTDRVDALLDYSMSSRDPNDHAAALTVMGRRYTKQAAYYRNLNRAGLINMALQSFSLACTTFSQMGEPVNSQWRINNRYHWYVALRLRQGVGIKQEFDLQGELYGLILKHDTNRRRVRIVKLIKYARGFGLWVALRFS